VAVPAARRLLFLFSSCAPVFRLCFFSFLLVVFFNAGVMFIVLTLGFFCGKVVHGFLGVNSSPCRSLSSVCLLFVFSRDCCPPRGGKLDDPGVLSVSYVTFDRSKALESSGVDCSKIEEKL